MAMRTDRRRGFTLIEIIVVMTIVTMLFGLGLPGLISAQRRLDNNNTLNVIAAVHNACVRNARQMGATGVIYGFTLTYSSASAPMNRQCATLVPWALSPGSSSYQYDMDGSAPNTVKKMEMALSRAKGDVGGVIPWDAVPGVYDATYRPTITFVDKLAPANDVTLGGVSYADTGMSIFVAYEPGTGFVHAEKTISPTLPGLSLGVGQMAPDAIHRRAVKINLWNVKQGRLAYVVSILATGVMDVKNG